MEHAWIALYHQGFSSAKAAKHATVPTATGFWLISIHLPLGGETGKICTHLETGLFQSTRLREARRGWPIRWLPVRRFQSTRL